MNAKEATIMKETIEALGYEQPATPISSDNSFVYKRQEDQGHGHAL
jgi:hypothetical protein